MKIAESQPSLMRGLLNPLFWGGVVVLFVSAIAVYGMADRPFGTDFTIALVAAGLSLVFLPAFLGYQLMRASGFVRKLIGGVFGLAAAAIGLTLLLLVNDYRTVLYPELTEPLTKEQWQEDLDFAADRLLANHKSHQQPAMRAQLVQEVARIRNNMEGYSAADMKVEFMKLVALPDDGHSRVVLRDPAINFHYYPFKLYWFAEGPHVIKAGRAHAAVEGMRLAAIDGVPIAEVFERLRPYVPAENRASEQHRFSTRGIGLIAELLHHVGIVNDVEQAQFSFDNSQGERVDVTTAPVPFYVWTWFAYSPRGDMRVKETQPALSENRKARWFEYQEETGTLFVQVNVCYDDERLPDLGGIIKPGDYSTLEEFARQLQATVDTTDFRRVILDIRTNIGGNIGDMQELITLFSTHPKFQQRGNLFVLLSPRTYSAAALFTTSMEKQTKAIFVGRTAGEGYSFYAQHAYFVTPHSRISFRVSQLYWRGIIPEDLRQEVTPHIPVAYSIEDFKANRDPDVEAVLAYRHPSQTSLAMTKQDKTLVGRYQLSRTQIVEIEITDDGRFFLHIDDFYPNSHLKVKTELYKVSEQLYRTDIRDALIASDIDAGQQQLSLLWQGTRKPLQPSEDLLVYHLLSDDTRWEDAVTMILADQTGEYAGQIQLMWRLKAIAQSALESGQPDKAMRLYHVAEELFGSRGTLHLDLAKAYEKMGKTAEALQSYQLAFERGAISQEELDRKMAALTAALQ